jgi:hypothetical protein
MRFYERKSADVTQTKTGSQLAKQLLFVAFRAFGKPHEDFEASLQMRSSRELGSIPFSSSKRLSAQLSHKTRRKR